MSNRMITWGKNRARVSPIVTVEIPIHLPEVNREIEIPHYDEEGEYTGSSTREQMYRPELKGSTQVTTLTRAGIRRLYGPQGPGTTSPVNPETACFGHFRADIRFSEEF